MSLETTNKYLFFLYTIFLLTLCTECNDRHIKIENANALRLSDTALMKISNLSNTNHFMKTLDSILIPRVPGTENHTKVRNFIIESMESLSWQVDRDAFTDKTPHGQIRFENIIATHNPSANRFLVLACHYDSKHFNDVEFLGATDSAVPCAMLINLACVLQEQLNHNKNNKLGLMFVFFDGEEAFVEWGPTDSIYGARHLAKKWDSESFLDKIDTLMLLDLLGAPDPKFYSFFQNTEDAYTKLMSIEDKLSNYEALERYASSGLVSRSQNTYFQPRSASLYIEDDHIPFLKRNVPILHLIPVPFPDVWHTADDNRDIIDYAVVENLNRIVRIFVMEYLQSGKNDM